MSDKMTYREIGAAVIEKIKKLPIHTEVSTGELALEVCPECSENDLFKIEEYVYKNIRKTGRWLDKSRYDNMIVGLPYNIPFVIRDSATEPEIIIMDDRER